ncbi:MAG TPA: hypothetical protein VGB17_15310 [Pyrinomonadaceae bacterium]|jgi:hypothetical protein
MLVRGAGYAVRKEFLIGALLFVLSLMVFIFSPVRTPGETKYSVLVSQSLLYHRSFALDHYELSLPQPLERIGNSSKLKGPPLELVGGHIYHYSAPGSHILSTPFVALMNLFGLSAVDSAGRYDPQGEMKIEKFLAALLMAALSAIFFLTARLVLPLGWSLVLALGAAFGTQVWSDASRVVEADTWAILLTGIAVYLLLALETGKREGHPVWLASLLAWSYFCRPTSSLTIIVISLYLFISQRRLFALYALTGLVWLALFIAYSWSNFGQLLPSYFQAGRLEFSLFGTALAGNLFSPGRGLLVYVPALLFVLYALVRYRAHLPARRLVLSALFIIPAYLLTISGFAHWWAGHSYGPRYCTGLIPWLALLAILSIKAMLSAHVEQGERGQAAWGWSFQLMAGCCLLALSIMIHARGAVSDATREWNFKPADVDQHPERLWDWRYPQFLAGLVRPPLPAGFYPLVAADMQIDFFKSEADQYLWYGWSGPEQEYRWSEEREAAFVFRLEEIQSIELQMELMPFLHPGQLDAQTLIVELNGRQLQTFTFREIRWLQITLPLPQESLRSNNTLVFRFPQATSVKAFGDGSEQRALGIAVKWLRLSRKDEPGSVNTESNESTKT